MTSAEHSQEGGGVAGGGNGVDPVRLEHIRKRFGPVVALRDVSLTLRRGEVLGLIGDNGAGKSTLIKIITGFLQPDAGVIFIDGVPTRLGSVSHARSLGIETVYQDLALIPGLSVYHNMFLKRERLLSPFPFLNNGQMKREALDHLRQMGVDIDSVETEVARLSGGQRQAIAIARAVYSRARVLLLDEPLAAMGAKEGAQVLELIRNLKERGDVSIIVIAHNYAHVMEVADRVNLLRQGAISFDRPTSETSLEELTDVMVEEYRRARRTA